VTSADRIAASGKGQTDDQERWRKQRRRLV
jgi:hypothetical protein